MSQCRASGCRGAAARNAPVDLCAAHLTAVADWAAAEYGVTDVLPSPCRACGSRLGVRYPSGWLCAVCEWRHGEVPDDDLAPVRVDVVYYLRAGDRIKIGTTASPRSRFAALGQHDVLAFERGDRRLERHRHEQFAAHRFAGSECSPCIPPCSTTSPSSPPVRTPGIATRAGAARRPPRAPDSRGPCALSSRGDDDPT